MGATGTSFSSTFRGRSTAMSQDELRRARESRATEALRMKDEQLKMLSEQVATLMDTLNKVLLVLLTCCTTFLIYCYYSWKKTLIRLTLRS